MHVNSAGPHVSPSGASPVTFSKGNKTVTAQKITKNMTVDGNMTMTFGNFYVNSAGPHISSSGASPVMFSSPGTAQQLFGTIVVKGRPSSDAAGKPTTGTSGTAVAHNSSALFSSDKRRSTAPTDKETQHASSRNPPGGPSIS